MTQEEIKKIGDMPAFPNDKNFQLGLSSEYEGLTKREYFAAMALQGFCAGDPRSSAETLAECSVEYADALIRELNKKNNHEE